MKIFGNVVNLFHAMASVHLKSGMTAFDATCGNGHDSVFLANLIGPTGTLYGMDIQQCAIDQTRERLADFEGTLKLYCDSHANVNAYIPEAHVDLAVFNLGYLPGGDKHLTTSVESTSIAIDQTLKVLKSGGILYLLCYPGHEAGKYEKEMLSEKLNKMPQRDVDVLYTSFENQKGAPPVMWVIEKK